MHHKVYVCIPVHNRIQYTLACLNSIFDQTYSNLKVVISDAGSTDGTFELISNLYGKRVKILKIDSSQFWTGGINSCIRYVLSVALPGDFIYTLNNDTILKNDCIEEAVIFSLNHPMSMVGSLNLFYDNNLKIEPSAFIFKKRMVCYIQKRLFSFGQELPDNYKNYYHVDALSGKGVLFPVNVFKLYGLFNEEKLPHYHADTEFVVRMKNNGYKPILFTKSVLFSHVNETGSGTLSVNFIDFISSFSNIRSALHLKSVISYGKLVYRSKWIFYVIPYYSFVVLGYFKRFVIKH